MAPSTGDPSTAVAVSHPVTVKIDNAESVRNKIEENKFEPNNHPLATILLKNVPSSAITSQPKIRAVDAGIYLNAL